MTDEEIKDFLVDTLLDGEDPGDGAYDLLTLAKDLIEGELELHITKVVNSENITTGQETYTTNPVSLPTGFLQPLTRKALFVGEIELYQVPIEQRELYKNDSSKFYIDYSTSPYGLYFCGKQVAGQTITIPYIKTTADIDGSGTNCIWPAKFHKLIAILASVMYLSGIDADDVNVVLAVGQNALGARLYKAFQYWDQKLKAAAMGGKAGARRDTRRRGPNRFQP